MEIICIINLFSASSCNYSNNRNLCNLNHVFTSGVDVIVQIEWFDLIDEAIQAFLIIPLYSILNVILKCDKDRFLQAIFITMINAFALYTVLSIIVLIYSATLISYMNPNETDLTLVNSYLTTSTIAFMV